MANAVETREREFHFTDADFERVRKLIYKHAGISLAPIKRDMVYSRLARRLRALAKGNDCLKCHAIDKDKKGPSLQKIAAKYKGKADGQDKVIKGMTDGKKVKMSDGTEEDHKKIDAKDPKELKNLADWILAQ